MILKVDSNNSLIDAISLAKAAQEEITIEFAAGILIKVDTGLPALESNIKTTIHGNGAELQGNGSGTGLILQGQNIYVEGLKVSGFTTGIYIQAENQNVQNVMITKSEFRNITSASVMTGIVNSDLSIEDIKITESFFEAPSKQRGGHCSCASCLFTAVYNTDDHPIHNVALRNVTWSYNHTVCNPTDGNLFSEGLMAHGACNYSFFDLTDMFISSMNDVTHSVFENLLVENNVMDGVYDIGITVLASFPARSDCLLKDVIIRGNKIRYFNTGINVGATNQCCSGDVKRMYTRNVIVENNILEPQVPGPFEPQIGIMIFATRCESQLITCVDSHMEDIIVRNNDISGHEVGIQVEAQHGTQELPSPSNVSNCSIRRLTIENNKIHGAQNAIRMSAVHLESRVDDFWGYKVPPFDKSLAYSTYAGNNILDDVTIEGNEIIEYDVALTLCAAWICGHAFGKNNTVGPHITIKNNKLDGGRKVFCYSKYITDEILYDDAIGFGNRVIGSWQI